MKCNNATMVKGLAIIVRSKQVIMTHGINYGYTS